MSSERPWLDHYPRGVPAEIDLDEFQSIPAVFEASLAKFRDNIAFSNMGKSITYGELDRLSLDFAGYLLGELKLKKGDRVAIMMPNCLQYPVALLGVLRAGLTVVNTNPMYTPRELKHQMVDSGASAILVLDNFGDVVQEVLSEVPGVLAITTGLGDMLGFPKSLIVNFVLRHVKKMVPEYDIPGAVRFRDTLTLGRMHQVSDVVIGHEDLAFLQYTGGTTGVAKGAMLTHRNLVANMQQAAAWVGGNIRLGEELIVTALPLYHIFALTANCLVFIKFGARNHLITNPRDMPGFVKELKSVPFTAITGVNTLFNGLLNTPGFDQVDFSHLHLTLGGGMAVQRAVADKWKQVTGCTLAEAYGLTETSPAVCINPLELGAFNGSIGLPVPSTDVCIKDDDGNMLPMGEIGELCVQGSAGHARLLATPGGYRAIHRCRRLAAYRRHGAHGREWVLLYRRSQEGHDPGVRLQRLSERDRRRDRDDARRAGSGGHRNTGREIRRSGEGVRGQEGSRAHDRPDQGVLPREHDRLQAAQACGVPRRIAQEQRRQDPAQGIAGSCTALTH